MFEKLYTTIENNPFRDTKPQLRSSETFLRREQEKESWDIFFQKPLDPPGSLSQYLLHSDPLYQGATVPLRKQILNEQLLVIQERVDKELVGRRWPRKKIQDALSNQINTPSYSELVEDVLCELFHIQKVILQRKSKSIRFFPQDLRVWKDDRPIQISDDEGCWAYEPVTQKDFLQWLTEKEEEHWKVQWPTAEGKLEEIKADLQKRNLVAHTHLGQKLKKEDWARTLGRSQAIETLARLRLRME